MGTVTYLESKRKLPAAMSCGKCNGKTFRVTYPAGCNRPLIKCAGCYYIVGDIRDPKYLRQAMPVIPKN